MADWQYLVMLTVAGLCLLCLAVLVGYVIEYLSDIVDLLRRIEAHSEVIEREFILTTRYGNSGEGSVT